MGTISAAYLTPVVSHCPLPAFADKTSSLCLEHPASPAKMIARAMDPDIIIFFILIAD
jgi:hypothetical protein